jgi:hypothetical protein
VAKKCKDITSRPTQMNMRVWKRYHAHRRWLRDNRARRPLDRGGVLLWASATLLTADSVRNTLARKLTVGEDTGARRSNPCWF